MIVIILLILYNMSYHNEWICRHMCTGAGVEDTILAFQKVSTISSIIDNIFVVRDQSLSSSYEPLSI